MKKLAKIRSHILLFVCVGLVNGIAFAYSETHAIRSKADSFYRVGKFPECIPYYLELIEQEKSGNNKTQLLKDYNNIANAYHETGNYKTSMDHYFKGLKISEELKDSVASGGFYYGIARNYFFLGEHGSAITYLVKAEEILSSRSDPWLLLVYELEASIYSDSNPDKAIITLHKALKLCRSLGNETELANLTMNLGLIHVKGKDYKTAEANYREALTLFTRLNDTKGVVLCYVNMGSAFHYQHESQKLSKAELTRGIHLLDTSLIIQPKLPNDFISYIYQFKSDLYSDMKQFDSSLKYFRLHKMYNDSVFNTQAKNEIAELELKYETEKRKKDLELLQSENRILELKSERGIWWIIAALALVCFLITLLFLFVLSSRAEKKRKQIEYEKNKIELEQKALRSQMNPHFIFNAINSIQSYVLDNNQISAYDYLTQFSKLIRIVLNNSLETHITLRSELEMIKLYVEIEQLRFSNKFDFILKISEEVDPNAIEIPAMLLQPYVENAVWHGLMNLKAETKGVLSIDIKSQSTLLKITIEDNGVGRQAAENFKKNDVHKSVGLKLTEQRIEILNKIRNYRDFKVLIEDVITNGVVSGTRVEIFLPIDAK